MDELAVSLQPSLRILGGATFPTTTKPIEIQGFFEIRETFVRFSGQTDLPMPPPANAKGLVLKEIGAALTAEPKSLEIELKGEMYIGSDPVGFAFQLCVAELIPTFLYARFDTLDLKPMFSALCKAGTLPKALRRRKGPSSNSTPAAVHTCAPTITLMSSVLQIKPALISPVRDFGSKQR